MSFVSRRVIAAAGCAWLAACAADGEPLARSGAPAPTDAGQPRRDVGGVEDVGSVDDTGIAPPDAGGPCRPVEARFELPQRPMRPQFDRWGTQPPVRFFAINSRTYAVVHYPDRLHTYEVDAGGVALTSSVAAPEGWIMSDFTLTYKSSGPHLAPRVVYVIDTDSGPSRTQAWVWDPLNAVSPDAPLWTGQGGAAVAAVAMGFRGPSFVVVAGLRDSRMYVVGGDGDGLDITPRLTWSFLAGRAQIAVGRSTYALVYVSTNDGKITYARYAMDDHAIIESHTLDELNEEFDFYTNPSFAIEYDRRDDSYVVAVHRRDNLDASPLLYRFDGSETATVSDFAPRAADSFAFRVAVAHTFEATYVVWPDRRASADGLASLFIAHVNRQGDFFAPGAVPLTNDAPLYSAVPEILPLPDRRLAVGYVQANQQTETLIPTIMISNLTCLGL